MPLRRSTLIILLLLLGASALALSFIDAARLRVHHAAAIQEKRGLVERLQLTDLSLFTEARYTRHPSQADLHSAFMDHPLAFEHFPTGALVSPPAALIDAYVDSYENLDRKTEVPD